jgi:hypothetical protein
LLDRVDPRATLFDPRKRSPRDVISGVPCCVRRFFVVDGTILNVSSRPAESKGWNVGARVVAI